MIAAANPNNAGLIHQLEERVKTLLQPPQLRLCTMCAVTRMAGELVYEKSLLWSANHSIDFIRATERSRDWTQLGACYMAEFILRPEVSVPLTVGALSFVFAGRQLWDTLNNMIEFRPENMTLLEAGLTLVAVASALGY